jgi:hypothetical protein
VNVYIQILDINWYIASNEEEYMRKIERAKFVLDHILRIDEKDGRWTFYDGSCGLEFYRQIEDPEGRWEAIIWAPSAGPAQLEPITECHSGLYAPLANCLDVWVPGFRKVLSVEFESGRVRLRMMRSGPWESLFDVRTTPSAGSLPCELKEARRGTSRIQERIHRGQVCSV